jgi:oligopeptide transport system permease protein
VSKTTQDSPRAGSKGAKGKTKAASAAKAASRQGGDAPSTSLFVKRRPVVESDGEAIRRPSISYWEDAWMRLRKNKVAIASAVYIAVLVLLAVVIPEVIPYAYDEQELWNKHAVPTLGDEALVVDLDAPPPELTVDAREEEGDVPASDAFGTEPPPSPTNVRIVGDPLTTGVTLAWDAVPGVEGYRVYRSISDDTLGVPVDDVMPEHVSYRDTSSLSKGDTYFYFVTAFNAFGDSADPEHVEVEPKLALPLDAALRLDPNAKPGQKILTKPHYLGTDYLGRDLLARVMMGARISLFIGIVAPLIYILIGIIYGSISGYVGGFVDNVMMRFADLVSTIPDLLVVILLQVALGSGVFTLIVALCAVAWARSAAQIRGEVLRLREMEFVHAANVLGTPFRKTVARHLLPNVMGTVLVLGTLAVPGAIFSEAFLSFIGLGIHPPMASWGVVTKEGARAFVTYPHELLVPSVLICLTMLAFNLLGDGLRDALDPKLRGAR